jgi:hypothetical protein
MVRPCSCPTSERRSTLRGFIARSTPMTKTATAEIAVIGIDIGKNLVPRRRLG